MKEESSDAVYGRLLEAVHISGYTAARACDELEFLLEADRWRQIGSGFTTGDEFIATINLSEFKIAVDRRKKLSQKLSAIQGTQRQIAEALGVSEATINRDVTHVTDGANGRLKHKALTDAIVTNVTPQLISQSGSEAAEQIKRLDDTKTKRQLRDDQKKAELGSAVDIESTGIIVGDFRDYSKAIGNDTTELIFTDPPYDRTSLDYYSDIARIGARILKPGGSLIAYCGQYLLPEILPMMNAYLRFWWLNACFHSSHATKARMNAYGIIVHWKPLLWFVKDDRGDRQTFVDDVVRGSPEKSHHEWQQCESDASYYIEKLTSPTGLVVDFFAGGGTTCVAAERLKRPWIAFEINPASAKKADDRLAAL